MASSELHVFLRQHADQVIDRWRRRVQELLGTDDLSRAELVNSMPDFLRELVASLDPSTARGALPESSNTAPEHGRHRLRTGFHVDQVIREYGVLGDTILEMVNEAGGQLTAREARLLLTSLHAGAGEAIAAYVGRRDDEARQQSAHHGRSICSTGAFPVSGS